MQEPAAEQEISVERLKQLRREIRETRDARMAAEKRAKARATTELALVAAARDRDVVTSLELESIRSQAEAVVAQMRQTWHSIDWIRVLVGRILPVGIELRTDASIRGGQRLMALLAEEEEARAEVGQRLAEAGINWFEPPRPALIDRKPHPNRDELKRIMDDAVADWRQREAAARRVGRSRSDYLPRES